MTAEIIVVNRLAAVLAADSAVTIGEGATAKIFRNENKLFEISNSRPVGLMIYNLLSFYDVPFEIIAKDFRSEMGTASRKHLFDWKKDFVAFLESKFKPTEIQELNHFKHQTIRLLRLIASEARDVFVQKVMQAGQQNPIDTQKEIENSYTKVLTRHIDIHLKHAVVDALGGPQNSPTPEEHASNFISKHGAALDSYVRSQLNNKLIIPDAALPLARELLKQIVLRQRPTQLCTGSIFAGFGSVEIFPSIDHIIVDGCYNGKLKWFRINDYDVDRDKKRGTVMAFAQPDVAHRFLYGVDDDLEAAIADYFGISFRDLPAVLKQKVKGIGDKLSAEIATAVEEHVESTKKHYFQTAGRAIKHSFFATIEEMVQFMPKQEMAELAEALVNITTLKRRVSQEQETVGGPIDVAVISRHEGFVWVKRKHYFPGDLNPRFLKRFSGSYESDATENKS